MTTYLSNKLRILSFALMIMVVVLHAQVIDLSPGGISVAIQKFISGRITRIAVSFFFLISGFLFCHNLDKSNIVKSFKRKISKRISTLLVPYLIWNILCLLIIALTQEVLPITISTDKAITSYDLYGYIVEIFHPTIAYQLWFVRDLFIVVLLSPVIYFFLKYFGTFFVILLATFNLFFWHIGLLSMVSIVFFTFGMYIAIYHKRWTELIASNNFLWILPTIWFIFNIILTITDYGSMLTFFINGILGILSIWVIYDLLYKSYLERWISLDIFSFSFFIYLVHEPILTVLKKLYIKSLGVDTIATSLLLYFFSPIVIISVAITVGRFFKRHTPHIYNLLTGAR